MNATFTVWQSPEGAHVRADFATLAEAESTAKRFAAAPELLAVLQAALESVPSGIHRWEPAARAAIAKAKGEA